MIRRPPRSKRRVGKECRSRWSPYHFFRKDAVVMDESRARHGNGEIGAWRLGPVSKYDYTTTIASIENTDEGHCRVSGRIDGNFPGGSAELTWSFSTSGGLISRLPI